MARSLVVNDPAKRVSAATWARYEQVGLEPTLELDELVLNWTAKGITDLDARGALLSINVERTIEGGSTVTVKLADPNGRLFGRGRTTHRARGKDSAAVRAAARHPVEVDEGWEPMLAPDTIGRAMEVELDGVVFRLVKVRYSSASQEAELTFEDRIVYWLKRKTGERRASRGSCTRAEFVLSLLREVRAREYRFVCPELHRRQPIDASSRTDTRRRRLLRGVGTRASSSSSSSSAADSEQSGGFPPSPSFTVKGVKARPDQVRNLHGVLTECSAQGCSRDVMVATVCCVIQESVAKRLNYGDAAGPDSRGLFQQRAPWGALEARLDPARSTRMFLTGGAGGQRGWKQANGSLQRVPGGVEAAVKKVQVSVGGYAQHESEARRIVGAWGGQGTGEGVAATESSYTRSYQFTRNADEDSWTAIKRLADEVGWRCFVVGNSVYFMSEDDLYARRARYEVTPDDPAVLDVSYDVDWGKPTSELELEVVLDRWGAPPGSVIVVTGYGPPDGRWLVSSVTRDYFAPTATVTLRQPGKEKLEPASERVTRAADASEAGNTSATSVDDGSKSSKFYAEAKRISDAGGTYVYGGGHGPSLSTLSSGQGLDCSSSTALALKRAGMFDGDAAIVSGEFARSWGQPGRGQRFTVWANGSHVWTQFHGIGNAWRFDTSPYGSGGRGPRLRFTPRPTDGFTPRHWPGC
jgi:hypothetical protein